MLNVYKSWLGLRTISKDEILSDMKRRAIHVYLSQWRHIINVARKHSQQFFAINHKPKIKKCFENKLPLFLQLITEFRSLIFHSVYFLNILGIKSERFHNFFWFSPGIRNNAENNMCYYVLCLLSFFWSLRKFLGFVFNESSNRIYFDSLTVNSEISDTRIYRPLQCLGDNCDFFIYANHM